MRVTVRPPRIAVLVQDEDGWPLKVTRAIECLSRTWGGIGGIIVPVIGEHRDRLPELFWPLLEAFDADRLSAYLPTLRGNQLANPAGFDEYAQGEATSWAERTGMTVEQARRSIFTEDHMREPFADLALAEPEGERARRTLSAYFHEGGGIYEHVFTADAETNKPLVDMTRVKRLEGANMNVLDTSLLGPRTQLLLAMRLGAIAPGYDAWLSTRVPKMNDRADPADLPVLIRLAYRGDVDASSWSFHRARRGATGVVDPHWREPRYVEDTPFGWTAAGSSRYARFAFRRKDEAPFIVIVGGTFVDFCIAYALDRMTARAIWLPLAPAEQGEEADAMRDAAASFLVEARRTDASTRFASTSLSNEALDALFTEIRGTVRGNFAQKELDEVTVGSLTDDDVLVSLPQRYLDRAAQDQIRFEPFQGDTMAGLLTTPMPSIGVPDDQDAVDWQVDAAIDDTRLPTRGCVAPLLTVEQGFTERVRSAQDGTSYVSHSWGFVPAGTRLDQRLARLRLRMPAATEIFGALLGTAGMRAEVSQAGIYTSGAMDIFGGFTELVRAYGHPTSRAVLESFRTPARRRTSADEDKMPGVYLIPLQRRFLSLSDLQQASGAELTKMRELVDSYIARGILYRGIVLGCPRCRFVGWYRAGEFSQTFTCTRCRSSWPLESKIWRDPPDEPTWRYELNEIVYQAVIANALAPVLTLQSLRADARLGFQFTPELNVYEMGAAQVLAELDICAVVEGKICIGEAKTVDRLAERGEQQVVDRLVRVAEAVTADELVIATTESALRPGTRDLVEKALRGRRTRLRVIEGSELEAAGRKVAGA